MGRDVVASTVPSAAAGEVWMSRRPESDGGVSIGVRRSTPERNEPDRVVTADDEEVGQDELRSTGLATCNSPGQTDPEEADGLRGAQGSAQVLFGTTLPGRAAGDNRSSCV